MDSLGDILSARDLPVNVLLSIREDALAGLDRFKGRIPHLFDNYLRLAPLDRRAGRAAIEGPLERYDRLASQSDRLTIEPELVETLLDQVKVGQVAAVLDESTLLEGSAADATTAPREGTSGTEEIEAPYLQLVLTRLWLEERAVGSDTLRRATLERLGGAQTIVRTHLDQVMAELTPTQIAVAAAVFQHLVTPSGSKIALTAEDLADWSGRDVESVRDLLDTLCAGQQRILRPVPPPVGSVGPPRYEIYHDVMGAAVLAWRRRHVADEQRVQAERRLVAEREAALVESATARRHLRRIRLVAVAMAAVLLVMAALGIVAFLLYREAQEQTLEAEQKTRETEQQQLLTISAEALDTDPSLSLASATQAYAKDPDDDAREAILVAASAPRGSVIAGPRPADPDAPDSVALDVTPDGQHIIVYDAEGGIGVLDPAGAVEETVSVPNLPGTVVYGVASDDAETVAVATDAGEVAVVDVSTGSTTTLPIDADTTPTVAIIDSDADDLVAVAPADGPMEIYHAATGALVATLGSGSFEAAVGTPDGKHVVTSDLDGRLRVWDPMTGALAREMPEGAAVTEALFLIQFYGDSIVGVAVDFSFDVKAVVVWDWESGADPVRIPVVAGELVQAWVNQAEGELLLSTDKTASVVDLDSGVDRGSFPAHADWVYDADSTVDNRWIATSGGDGRVLVWSRHVPNRPTFELLGHRGGVLTSKFVRDGAAVVSLGIDGTVRMWELPPVTRHDTHQDWVLRLDTNADRSLILTASRDGSAEVLDATDIAAPVASIESSGALSRAEFDPSDAHRVFTLTRYGVAPVLWQWKDDGTSAPISLEYDPIPEGFLVSMDVSVDGTAIVGGDTLGRVHLWNAETGKLGDDTDAYTLSGYVNDVAFDPAGDRIVAATLDEVRVWTLSGTEAPIELTTRRAAQVSFDRQGEHIAVSAEGGIVDIWTSSGELVHTLLAHGGRVGHPSFSPDGRLLAMGTAEGLIEVRDVETGRVLILSRVHGDSVNDVAFLTDEGAVRIVSASDDTTVAISDCASCTDAGADTVIREARAGQRERASRMSRRTTDRRGINVRGVSLPT